MSYELKHRGYLFSSDVELLHNLFYRKVFEVFDDRSDGQTRVTEDPCATDPALNTFYSGAL